MDSRSSHERRDHRPEHLPGGKLRLLFAIGTGSLLAARLSNSFLPPDFPQFWVYVIFLGLPILAVLLTYLFHRGLFDALLGDRGRIWPAHHRDR